MCSNSVTNVPSSYGLLHTSNYSGIMFEQTFVSTNGSRYIRKYSNDSWSNWEVISTDMPSFYKDYSTLTALSAGLGVMPCKKKTLNNREPFLREGRYYLNIELLCNKNNRNIYPVAYYSNDRTGWELTFDSFVLESLSSTPAWFLTFEEGTVPTGTFNIDVYYLD